MKIKQQNGLFEVLWVVTCLLWLLFYSKRIHSDQKEIQVPVLQFLCHAPVYPEETHAIPHRGETLSLWNLWEKIHTPGAHETAHLGK